MQINQSTLQALYMGFRTLFLEAYQAGKALWPNLAMQTTSTNAEEIYHWLGAVPGMRKLVDEIQIRNLSAHRYAIVNEEFESTVAVKSRDVERDNYGIYNPLMQSMGRAAAQHKDELLGDLLVGGFDILSYTGVAFFGLNHEPKAGGSKFSNKGLKKFSRNNFRTARQNMKSRLNAEGRPMNLGLDLVLVVSPKYEEEAREVLVAEKVGGGNTNVDKGTARLEVWPQLAAAGEDCWFLFEAGHPVKPFIIQIEKDVDLITQTNPDDHHVFTKKEFLYQAYGRYNAGFALPELAWGSTGENAA